MKLSRCDVCKKIMRDNEVGTLTFEEGSGTKSEIIVDEGDGWTNLCKIKIDICRKCMLPILKTVYPNVKYLPEEEYKDGV